MFGCLGNLAVEISAGFLNVLPTWRFSWRTKTICIIWLYYIYIYLHGHRFCQMVALACFCYLLTSTLYQDTHVGTIYIYNTLKKQMYTSLYRCGIHIYIYSAYTYTCIFIYIYWCYFFIEILQHVCIVQKRYLVDTSIHSFWWIWKAHFETTTLVTVFSPRHWTFLWVYVSTATRDLESPGGVSGCFWCVCWRDVTYTTQLLVY